MAGGSSGIVFGLTTAAVATVGILAFQASAGVPDGLGGPHADRSPSAAPTHPARGPKDPTALPVDSGTGARVVYSVTGDRVWLVGAGDKVRRTFLVLPGKVDPAPGTYEVTSRSNSVTGTDGAPVRHVVRFADVDGVAVGFSTPAGPATAKPDEGVRTGGIRESRKDGDAMWAFATIGRPVVVVR
ncbi:hypothetical protein ABT301_14135 [Streptomyces sp. NPDC000987]|uniref:hypothetical protein n=1 Tax=Streptomyces sp. NPDC000987 TaxID=3154374 RepID=UPI00332F85AF